MDEFNTIEEVSNNIKSRLDSIKDKKGIVLLYAFNSTGKTRLSTLVVDHTKGQEILRYNAFTEDLFSWDNESYVLKFDPNSDIIRYIIDEGLENLIADNFQNLIQSKIFPVISLSEGEVMFNFSPGDDRSQENIKISRSEESLFVWSIFYTVLESALFIMSENEDIRETDKFNRLKYVVIDDPVSSIDDTRIITMAVELIRLIEYSKNNNIKFLITTHHALFYNVLYNEFKNKKGYKTESLVLSKNSDALTLSSHGDTPFGYHLLVKHQLEIAIDTGEIHKYHFNLLRGLCEKTANFLGYSNWYNCLADKDKHVFAKLVNQYSHGRLSDLESKYIPEDHKDIFKEVFNSFMKDYKWAGTNSNDIK